MALVLSALNIRVLFTGNYLDGNLRHLFFWNVALWEMWRVLSPRQETEFTQGLSWTFYKCLYVFLMHIKRWNTSDDGVSLKLTDVSEVLITSNIRCGFPEWRFPTLGIQDVIRQKQQCLAPISPSGHADIHEWVSRYWENPFAWSCFSLHYRSWSIRNFS